MLYLPLPGVVDWGVGGTVEEAICGVVDGLNVVVKYVGAMKSKILVLLKHLDFYLVLIT